MRVTFKTDQESAQESCQVAGTKVGWFADDKSVVHTPLLALSKMELAAGLNDGSRNRLRVPNLRLLRFQVGRGDPLADCASGLLLHPSVDGAVDEAVVFQVHGFRFVTVDLTSSTRTAP